jgi:hypothetical protein
MINRDKLERELEHLLQRKVKFTINDKITRRGKLLIYQVKDFYITFTLITASGDKKTYDLPYPFKVTTTLDGAIFDYTLNTLSQGNSMMLNRLKVLTRVKKNKIYDSKVHITQDE